MTIDAEIAARWAKVLYAESVLQRSREELSDAIEDMADGKPDLDRLRMILAEQYARPSPDFRALLLKTREQLKILTDAIVPSVSGFTMAPGVGIPALKEAMRLTDVERLQPWAQTTQGVALRKVIGDLIGELSLMIDHHHGAQNIDDLWLAQTKSDLVEALEDPEKFLARCTPSNGDRREGAMLWKSERR